MNLQLRAIGKVRPLLNEENTKTLVNALVTSRLDYCNSILYGTHDYVIARLQRAQNYAARVIKKKPKCSHVTPLLKELHWLPVDQRIQFKVLVMAYKAKNALAPEYLN